MIAYCRIQSLQAFSYHSLTAPSSSSRTSCWKTVVWLWWCYSSCYIAESHSRDPGVCSWVPRFGRFSLVSPDRLHRHCVLSEVSNRVCSYSFLCTRPGKPRTAIHLSKLYNMRVSIQVVLVEVSYLPNFDGNKLCASLMTAGMSGTSFCSETVLAKSTNLLRVFWTLTYIFLQTAHIHNIRFEIPLWLLSRQCFGCFCLFLFCLVYYGIAAYFVFWFSVWVTIFLFKLISLCGSHDVFD